MTRWAFFIPFFGYMVIGVITLYMLASKHQRLEVEHLHDVTQSYVTQENVINTTLDMLALSNNVDEVVLFPLIYQQLSQAQHHVVLLNTDEIEANASYSADKSHTITRLPLRDKKHVLEINTLDSFVRDLSKEFTQTLWMLLLLGVGLLIATLLFLKIDKKIVIFETLASTDFLTGISNRRQFNLVASQIRKEAIRNEKCFSVILFDIDYFKKVNDTYGHDVGDKILKMLSVRIKNAIREQDHFARGGGEEFIVVLANTPQQRAYEVAEKLRGLVSKEHFSVGKHPLAITCSFGISVSKTKDIKPLKELIEQADESLYEAKKAGRNRVC